MPEVNPLLIDAGQGIRFYSLARHALLQALRLAGVGPGKHVLLPAFICRDLLAPLAYLRAIPVWYAVDEVLQPVGAADNWPEAAVVLAVNYFGFPQNLVPFRAYAARTGAVLIEDNAHGFLSRDAGGHWLGTRGNYGLFSMRKTLRIPDGAALLVNDLQAQQCLPPPLPHDGPGLNPAQTAKAKMRRIPMFGEFILSAGTNFARRVRKLRTGSDLPQPDPLSETEMPAGASPWYGLCGTLRDVDVEAEIRRRREAYVACAALAAGVSVDPVFKQLPANCAPYGFPFRSGPAGRRILKGFADRNGFDLVTWPDLPGEIVERAPEHYRNVLMVNFLW